MKAWVVYDSVYGNTEKIAKAIGNVLENQAEVAVLRIGDTNPDHFSDLSLLFVGSPTQRLQPTPATNDLLKRIPKNGLKGVKVAAFDTRLTLSQIEATPTLAFFVRIFGYAAKPITNRLVKKGGELVVPPEGFFVAGMEGPLVEGELERAAQWAKQILMQVTQ